MGEYRTREGKTIFRAEKVQGRDLVSLGGEGEAMIAKILTEHLHSLLATKTPKLYKVQCLDLRESLFSGE